MLQQLYHQLTLMKKLHLNHLLFHSYRYVLSCIVELLIMKLEMRYITTPKRIVTQMKLMISIPSSALMAIGVWVKNSIEPK